MSLLRHVVRQDPCAGLSCFRGEFSSCLTRRPRLTHRSAWTSQLGALPVIEGTVIRLQVEHLPSGATPKPVWLWWSGTDATTADVDRLWQAFLRRFDIEHTFRLFKQTLGWTCPNCSPRSSPRSWRTSTRSRRAGFRCGTSITSGWRSGPPQPVSAGRRCRRGVCIQLIRTTCWRRTRWCAGRSSGIWRSVGYRRPRITSGCTARPPGCGTGVRRREGARSPSGWPIR